MNWWLVSNGMKHGMITVINTKDNEMAGHGGMNMEHQEHNHSQMAEKPSISRIAKMTVFSILCLVAGVFISIKIL